MRTGVTLPTGASLPAPRPRRRRQHHSEEFLYELKAGPAGGRLRRPSSAAKPDGIITESDLADTEFDRMTLILTRASPQYILQVSDRLLTRGRRRRPFDPVSNKTIVYFARDALVSIAYSGNAYLDETPTDQWMAGVLIGKRLEPDDPGGLTIGPREGWLDIGQSIELLRTELGSAISRLPQSEEPPSLHVVIAGWQWNRKRARPIVTHMVSSATYT